MVVDAGHPISRREYTHQIVSAAVSTIQYSGVLYNKQAFGICYQAILDE